MIAFGVLIWIAIGLMLYMWYGSAEGSMTPIYWCLMWPIMLGFTILEHKLQIELWLSGWRNPEVRWNLWRKISEFFKIRID